MFGERRQRYCQGLLGCQQRQRELLQGHPSEHRGLVRAQRSTIGLVRVGGSMSADVAGLQSCPSSVSCSLASPHADADRGDVAHVSVGQLDESSQRDEQLGAGGSAPAAAGNAVRCQCW